MKNGGVLGPELIINVELSNEEPKDAKKWNLYD